MRTHNIAQERKLSALRLRLNAGACFCILLGCLATVSSARAEAQDVTDSWENISKANKPITACRVVWKRVLVIKPNPKVDVDKQATAASNRAQQQGLSESQVREREQAARRDAQRDFQGRTIVTELACVRVGEIIKCDIFYPELKTRSLDFYDGVNAVFVRGLGQDGQESGDGYLSRDVDQILQHSIGTGEVARFLVGIPLQQALLPSVNKFTPENTRVSKDAAGNFLLDTKVTPSLEASEYPGALTLAKENLRPVAYESFAMNIGVKGGQVKQKGNSLEITGGGELIPAKGKPYRRVTLAGYTQFDGGISFPSKIIATTPNVTAEYSLVKAEFNEAVDPMELRLPANIRIADARFGDDKMAVYKPKDGKIPSDQDVKAMLGQEQEKKEAKAANKAATEAKSKEIKQSSAPLPLAPLAGLLLMAMGGMLWTRSREDS